MNAPVRRPIITAPIPASAPLIRRAGAEKWSPRRSLGFVVVVCTAFWVGVGFLMFGGM